MTAARLRVGVMALGVGAAAAACSLLTDLSPIAPSGDAGQDAPVAPPPNGFVLGATPAHVTLDPGEGIDIAVRITRDAAFTGLVDVNVNDVGGLASITTNPALLTFTGGAPVTLHLDVSKDAKTPQDGVVTLLGVSRADPSKTATTSFGVRIGSVLLDTTTDTKLTVPPWANRLLVKAWGGGGGAGGGCINGNMPGTIDGAPGGAGGFASAWFGVAAGDVLDIGVGTPGTSGNPACGTYNTCRGGGGGGFTRVHRNGAHVLVVGGGGGGGSAWLRGNYCDYGGTGEPGVAGGGGDGDPRTFGYGNPRPNISATTSAGGASGGNQGTAGAPLAGGAGGNAAAGGAGAPGGGAAGSYTCCVGAAYVGGSGGGGGGGWFGGGGGGQMNIISGGTYNGGGGGSGSLDGGADAAVAAGKGSTPGGAGDPDYRANTATGGVAGMNATPATGGRVVVRAAKPF